MVLPCLILSILLFDDAKEESQQENSRSDNKKDHWGLSQKPFRVNTDLFGYFQSQPQGSPANGAENDENKNLEFSDYISLNEELQIQNQKKEIHKQTHENVETAQIFSKSDNTTEVFQNGNDETKADLTINNKNETTEYIHIPFDSADVSSMNNSGTAKTKKQISELKIDVGTGTTQTHAQVSPIHEIIQKSATNGNIETNKANESVDPWDDYDSMDEEVQIQDKEKKLHEQNQGNIESEDLFQNSTENTDLMTDRNGFENQNGNHTEIDTNASKLDCDTELKMEMNNGIDLEEISENNQKMSVKDNSAPKKKHKRAQTHKDYLSNNIVTAQRKSLVYNCPTKQLKRGVTVTSEIWNKSRASSIKKKATLLKWQKEKVKAIDREKTMTSI